MKRVTRTPLAAWLAFSLVATPVFGQTELGTVMKKHYTLRSVSCNTCHIKEQEEKTKDQLTPFGVVVAKLVEGQKITERLNAVKDLEEEKELVKEAIEKEFAETVKKLDGMKDASGKTYAELIQAGEIDGLKPRK
ncbi:MAG: hypothetical protein MUF25_22300 [Pirellulaceae bacterium]|jgi:hypothetical protein|nr:hypothetical protein [Pirellulaceae bacterium]